MKPIIRTIVPIAGLLCLAAGMAAAQTTSNDPGHRPRLWDPEDPSVCILSHNPGNLPLELPEPVFTPRIDERFPGASEGNLAGVPHDVVQVASLTGSLVTFTVIYTDPAGQGFNDPTLGPARKSAFLFATGIWAALLEGTANISIDASFPSLGGTASSATLGSAGPGSFAFGAPPALPNTYYPEALLEHLSGTDPNVLNPDIQCQFNADVDGPVVLGATTWYYGIDANPPAGDIDFATVVLHELCHGLGFSHSFNSGGGLSFGDPFIWDRFLVDAGGTPLMNQTPSPALVTSPVFWSGAQGVAGYVNDFGGSGNPPVFAPNPWEPGSSLAHLNESTFSGGIWELMTPYSSNLVQDPDPIVLGILQDMGYDSVFTGIYVDSSWSGAESGTPAQPYNTLDEGLAAALLSPGSILFLAPGSYAPSAPTSVAFEVTLRVWGSGAVIIDPS